MCILHPFSVYYIIVGVFDIATRVTRFEGRLRDLFLFLLRKENNLQILAFLINTCNCIHSKDSIWLSKRSMFFGGVTRVP